MPALIGAGSRSLPSYVWKVPVAKRGSWMRRCTPGHVFICLPTSHPWRTWPECPSEDTSDQALSSASKPSSQSVSWLPAHLPTCRPPSKASATLPWRQATGTYTRHHLLHTGQQKQTHLRPSWKPVQRQKQTLLNSSHGREVVAVISVRKLGGWGTVKPDTELTWPEKSRWLPCQGSNMGEGVGCKVTQKGHTVGLSNYSNPGASRAQSPMRAQGVGGTEHGRFEDPTEEAKEVSTSVAAGVAGRETG